MASRESYRQCLTKLWQCPICFCVPRKTIWQCRNGHSICSFCASKVPTCQTCSVEIGENNKIRNLSAEEMLATLLIKCCWKECQRTLALSEIYEHEERCVHNLNPSKICRVFGQNLNCSYEFTMKSLQDPYKVEQFLDHMKCCHDIEDNKISLGDPVFYHFDLDSVKICDESSAQKSFVLGMHFVNTLVSLEYQNRKHLFAFVKGICKDEKKQAAMSFNLLQITPYFGQQEYSSFKANLFVNKSIPRQPTYMLYSTWAIMPMRMDEFMRICEMAAGERPPFPASIPLTHLESYYATPNGQIETGFVIHAN